MVTFKNVLSWTFLSFLILTLPHMSIFIHEMGHFTVMKLMNIGLEALSVGNAKSDLWLSFEFLEVPFSIYSMPGGGFVRSLSDISILPLQQFFISLAGGVTSLYYMIIVLYFIQRQAGYKRTFLSFLWKMHTKTAKFFLYLSVPYFFVRRVIDDHQHNRKEGSFSRFIRFLVKDVSSLWLSAVYFIFLFVWSIEMQQQFFNLIPGVVGAYGDGTRWFHALLSSFDFLITLPETAFLAVFLLWLFVGYYLWSWVVIIFLIYRKMK